MNSSDKQRIKQTYDRAAGVYDIVDWLIPDAWRLKATQAACGRVLEVGIGTGLNLPHYPACCREIFGIDLSPGMLSRAGQRASLCKAAVELSVMDVQELRFDAASFDCVLAAFVFCTVPDPGKGLKECCRVLKPGGTLILLEHMGSNNKLLRRVMDWLNPVTVKFIGDHITRDTVGLVARAGYKIQNVENLLGDVVRLVIAEKEVLNTGKN